MDLILVMKERLKHQSAEVRQLSRRFTISSGLAIACGVLALLVSPQVEDTLFSATGTRRKTQSSDKFLVVSMGVAQLRAYRAQSTDMDAPPRQRSAAGGSDRMAKAPFEQISVSEKEKEKMNGEFSAYVIPIASAPTSLGANTQKNSVDRISIGNAPQDERRRSGYPVRAAAAAADSEPIAASGQYEGSRERSIGVEEVERTSDESVALVEDPKRPASPMASSFFSPASHSSSGRFLRFALLLAASSMLALYSTSLLMTCRFVCHYFTAGGSSRPPPASFPLFCLASSRYTVCPNAHPSSSSGAFCALPSLSSPTSRLSSLSAIDPAAVATTTGHSSDTAFPMKSISLCVYFALCNTFQLTTFVGSCPDPQSYRSATVSGGGNGGMGGAFRIAPSSIPSTAPSASGAVAAAPPSSMSVASYILASPTPSHLFLFPLRATHFQIPFVMSFLLQLVAVAKLWPLWSLVLLFVLQQIAFVFRARLLWSVVSVATTSMR